MNISLSKANKTLKKLLKVVYFLMIVLTALCYALNTLALVNQKEALIAWFLGFFILFVAESEVKHKYCPKRKISVG
ncbi:MAG: hypothetical protein CL760_05515 [Chloroflexi bacterium]|nr:hypothetical protein [Chloroflexota bacterium]|tara:strand:- start:56299 stop:56526 length:228 start_codon:yes stop_codon:yes gene_type:complete